MPLRDRHPATRCEPRKVLLQEPVACAGAICVDNLTIRFGSTVALDKVSVRVPARALTIVVGPGGCGKTTLLKALACEIPWGSGSVMIQEVPARLWPAKKRESCMLTCPWRAGGACTLAATAPTNQSGEIERWNEDATVENALDLIGMKHLFGRPWSNLGQRDMARLQLAATLAPFRSQAAQRPVHLWLDDPLDGLDDLRQHRLLQWLKNSADDRHTTVVTVTAYGLARAYADHAILLREGCLISSGAPADALGPAELTRAFGEFHAVL